jgi:hypothetical protein
LLSFLFCFAVLGLEFRAFTCRHSTNPFLWWVFSSWVSQTICVGWIQTSILLISASFVTRITGVSHQHPDCSWVVWAFYIFRILIPHWMNSLHVFFHCVGCFFTLLIVSFAVQKFIKTKTLKVFPYNKGLISLIHCCSVD